MGISKGECRFCNKIFSGRGIGKHLLVCWSKKEKDETLNGRKNEGYIYHLKILDRVKLANEICHIKSNTEILT